MVHWENDCSHDCHEPNHGNRWMRPPKHCEKTKHIAQLEQEIECLNHARIVAQ